MPLIEYYKILTNVYSKNSCKQNNLTISIYQPLRRKYFFFRERDNTWALERAKTNVIRWYPVVGVLEHIEESLQAFEAEFPYFFKNAVHIYEQFREY